MIPRTEDAPAASVPDHKREIAQEMVDASFTPTSISVKDQLCAARRLQITGGTRQFADQGISVIDPHISNDPEAFIEVRDLRAAIGFCGRAEKCVTQTDAARSPDLRTVRTTEG